MILYLFKYCLPMLFGYTLFIGLAGRMNPFTKPEYPEERPSWFLGIWTGLTVALVLGVGLHMAYSISLESAQALLPPTAFFMGVLLLPGFAGYSLYRRHVSRVLRETAFAPATQHRALRQRLQNDAIWRRDEEEHSGHPEQTEAELADAAAEVSGEPTAEDDNHAPIVASFLDSAELQILDSHEHPAANGESEVTFETYLESDFDLDNETTLDDYLDDTVFEGFHYSDLELDATHLDATRLIDMSDIDGAQTSDATEGDDSELPLFDESEFTQTSEHAEVDVELPFSLMESADDEFAAAHEEFLPYQEVPSDDTVDQAENDSACEDSGLELSTQNADHLQDTAEPEKIIEGTYATSITSLELGQRLAKELAAHEETSRQLRITRKVLARLTPSAQESASTQAVEPVDNDSLIDLKEELAASLALQATHLSEANSEKDKRLKSEEACARMQQELIQAKHDIRRSSAARAKALSTANKAIAFARQTLQVRALLEEELQMARNTLSKRQDTISSVIRELENEKQRTQEEVAFMAKQLVIHDRLPTHHHDEERRNDDMEHALPVTANGKITEAHRMGPE